MLSIAFDPEGLVTRMATVMDFRNLHADLDQTPQNTASDQGLRCLQILVVLSFFSQNHYIT